MTIERLIIKDTIEEKIVELQKKLLKGGSGLRNEDRLKLRQQELMALLDQGDILSDWKLLKPQTEILSVTNFDPKEDREQTENSLNRALSVSKELRRSLSGVSGLTPKSTPTKSPSQTTSKLEGLVRRPSNFMEKQVGDLNANPNTLKRHLTEIIEPIEETNNNNNKKRKLDSEIMQQN